MVNPASEWHLGLEVRLTEYMNPALSAFIHEAQEFTKDLLF
jgi:hypothetical protein